MLMSAGLVGLGLALLLAGGEALVRGASGLALAARVPPAVVGLTIVAAGTSAPELVVSVQAALAGSAGIAAGNVVGSNLFNIAVILGVTALVQPLPVELRTLRAEWPVLVLSAGAFVLAANDGRIHRGEGAAMLGALLVTTVVVIALARREPASDDAALATASLGRTGALGVALNLGAIVVGIAVLALGSTLLVDGASALARAAGVSDTVIGLTVVSAGTSTPELAASLVAARRGQAGMAIGNVIGSNIFNVLAIAGGTALVLPLDVPAVIVSRDAPLMVLASLALFGLMRTGYVISRREGAVLVSAYLVYLAVLIAGT